MGSVSTRRKERTEEPRAKSHLRLGKLKHLIELVKGCDIVLSALEDNLEIDGRAVGRSDDRQISASALEVLAHLVQSNASGQEL